MFSGNCLQGTNGPDACELRAKLFGADQHVCIGLAPTLEIGMPWATALLAHGFHELFEIPLILVGKLINDLLVRQK